VVVFSQWRRMLELGAWVVSDLLQGARKRALFFTGQEGQRRRTQNLVDFHDDPDAAVLFLTDAGGVGLNLQRAASACINLELPWNPAVLEQRIGRIHRLGQERPIDVYNLMTRGSIEERIAGLVADKRALFKGLFEGTTDELRFEGGRAIAAVLERLTEGIREDGGGTTDDSHDSDDASDERLDAETDTVVPGGPSARNPGTGSETPTMGSPEPTSSSPDANLSPDDAATRLDALRGGAPPVAVQGPGGDDVARLFGAVTVNRRDDGSLVIEAPPEAARALASLFAGMSRLMASAAAPEG
jgi:superfamily II DNA/RNA helicase